MEAPAVPFKSTRSGRTPTEAVEIEGVMRLEPGRVVLEYVVKRTEWGAQPLETVTSPIERIELPFAEIAGIDFKRGLLRAGAVRIRVRRLGRFGEITEPSETECSLRVERRHRLDARDFAGTTALALAEGHWRSLES